MGAWCVKAKAEPSESSIHSVTSKREKNLNTDMSTNNLSTFGTDNVGVKASNVSYFSQERSMVNEKVDVNSFTWLKQIGEGSYARVFLVRKIDSGKYFAMKVLKKKGIKDERSKERVITERNIIKGVQHPFIVKLHYSFQTEEKLYFVLDLLNGGDLFQHIARSGKFKENRAKFYAAEIILALEHLHSNNIVYRDLKPQNIIIGKDGHVKLTDFGLSKNDFNQDQQNTICGTMKYIAPEAITGKKYNHMVDWWSLGIILYRMLTGKLPYPSNKNHEVRLYIIKWEIKLSKYKFSKTAYKFLRALLDKNPETRLGANGIDEIKNHDFFRGIDWEELYKKNLDPPYIPNLKSEADMKLISREQLEKEIESCSLDDTDVLSGNMRGEYFQDFTYTKDELLNSGRQTMFELH